MTFLPHARSDRWLEEVRRALPVRGAATIQAWEQSGRGAWSDAHRERTRLAPYLTSAGAEPCSENQMGRRRAVPGDGAAG